ncbi:MAG TPA: lipoyl synthase [Candidatus Nanoarchaeia archaeon]|nr:lipoyl synthase [Candidatus Nanoarchaeia archaeon]
MEQLVKPPWLKIRPPTEKFADVKSTLKKLNLVTVCEEAHCPNISECWSGGTATFMVLGDTCTRGCRFCNIKSARIGRPIDKDEPKKLAQAIAEWKLDYVVITSVDRDDLPDQGAGHFAECIREIKKQLPTVIVEVLIPDFRGNVDCLKTIIDAQPDVIAHNLETVKSMQRRVRDVRANYEQSLFVLKAVKDLSPKTYTKSSLMLGLGESEKELVQAFADLRTIGVSVLTLGQYLRPSDWHLAVVEYVTPERFDHFKGIAEQMGFLYCAAGPFVRSSYKAGELFLKNVIRGS